MREREKRERGGGGNREVINIAAVLPFYDSIGRASGRASALVTTRNAGQRENQAAVQADRRGRKEKGRNETGIGGRVDEGGKGSTRRRKGRPSNIRIAITYPTCIVPCRAPRRARPYAELYWIVDKTLYRRSIDDPLTPPDCREQGDLPEN